jgi:hypothetical protein
MLMGIPEDSPMRRPLLSIRRAGEEAAAIVQDLLALARRGVSADKVVCVNTVLN